MSSVDQFFSDEIKAIASDSKAIARRAAEELYDSVRRQIRQNFRNPSTAFIKGLKIYEFDDATYVRLSPILSSHAQETDLRGGPNIWILLPDGARLGFKRIGKGFSWDTLRRRYGTRLSFAPIGSADSTLLRNGGTLQRSDGHVVLYRDRGVVHPIYKIQASVTTKQRIEFYEKAEEIANNYSMKIIGND